MQMLIIPTYRDLFGNNVPEVKSLIDDIPSDFIIHILSFINAQLVLRPDGSHLQLFHKLTERIPIKFSSEIRRKIFRFTDKHKEKARIFALPYVLDFIQYELKNYKIGDPNFDEKDPEMSVRLLKAYFVFAELGQGRINENISKIEFSPKEPFFFQKRTWVMAVEQYELNQQVDPIYQAIKAFVFLQFFAERDQYRPFVEQFLKNAGQETIWHYIFRLMELVHIGIKTSNESQFSTSILTIPPQDFVKVFEFLSVDPSTYAQNEKRFENYKGLREFPLLNFRNEYYIVLNWNFLYEKLYRGLVFDFFNKSGIQSKIKSLTGYLGVIGKDISENIAFRNLLHQVLHRKYSILQFDNNKKQGQPDLYFRSGNKIILFELKDALFPAEIISNYSYESLVTHIERKFFKDDKGKDVGVTQLSNHIRKLNEGYFDFDDFEKKGIKKRNLEIFSVLVFTNPEHALPGIEDYLRRKFLEEVSKLDEIQPLKFKVVHDVVMIDFEFFFKCALLDVKPDLSDLLKQYKIRLRNTRRKFDQSPSGDTALKLFPGFYSVHADIVAKKDKNPDIDAFFRLLGIKIGLPEE